MAKILVTGGAGYIGSHTVLELLMNKHSVVVIDKVDDSNFNGRIGALKSIEKLLGIKLGSDIFKFYNGDVGSNKFKPYPKFTGSGTTIKEVVKENSIDSCIDFAAFIGAGTSMREPEKYLMNNSINFLNLVPALYDSGVKTIVKSSTAAVYGNMDPGRWGFDEDSVLTETKESCLDLAETKKGKKQGEELHQYLIELTIKFLGKDKGLLRYVLSAEAQNRLRKAVNVYGWSKIIDEIFLEYFSKKFRKDFCILRYFNAWGVNNSCKLLEDHKPETHLIPKAMDCIINYEKRADKKSNTLKKGEFLLLFGTDFPTKDGTCIRDYVHVINLAKVHVKALKKKGVYNLAPGIGFSNIEVLKCITSGVGAELIILSKTDKGKKYNIKFESNSPCEVEIIDESLLKKKALYAMEWEKRAGDPPKLIANSKKASRELNWKAKTTISNTKNMRQVYISRKNNPNGYNIKE